MIRTPLLAVGLLAVGVLAGCTSHADGAPIPQTTTSATGATTTSSAPPTSRLLPPRPRDLDITSLDPCTALTVPQMKELEYDRGWQRPPGADVDGPSGEPNCAYGSRQRRSGSLITFVTNDGAEVWLTDPDHETELPPEKTTVSGFPALQITVPKSNHFPDQCRIIVDVHDGQYIQVFSNKLVGGSITGAAAYCAEAKKVAAMIIENAENR